MTFGWSSGFAVCHLPPPAPHLSSLPGNFKGVLHSQAEAQVFRQCPQAKRHLG